MRACVLVQRACAAALGMDVDVLMAVVNPLVSSKTVDMRRGTVAPPGARAAPRARAREMFLILMVWRRS